MKILSVKKTKTLYFTLSYSFENNSYTREYSIGKRSFITFFGIPLYSTKLIFVRATDSDLFEITK
jgi:hypothetical protein